MEMKMPTRQVLLNPGPATTTDSVKMAQVIEDICPREAEFGDVMRAVSHDLVRIVHGENDFVSILFCGSGTICIDSALSSFLPGGGASVLILNNGAYSTRAAEVCEYYGLPHLNMRMSNHCPIDPTIIDGILAANPSIELIYTTHHETGSGILNPIREIGEVAHRHNCIFIVDTIASYAMVPIDVNLDNIDVCMASAQKGIQGMTGLSFLIARKSIVEKSSLNPKRSYYCNVYQQYEYFERTGQMHFTPPVQTIFAAKQALLEYFEEGEEAKWKRHLACADRIHVGLARLRLEEAVERRYQSGLVVSVKYPRDPKWDFGFVHDYCREKGFTIYPGKIPGCDSFRLCTLGAITPIDIDDFFEVFKDALQKLGMR